MGLEGELSGDIGSLSELETLDISYNKDLTMPLPRAIGELRKLSTFFNGPIPDEIGFLKELHFISLNSNSFTGRIPHSIGNLSNLYWLDLADNELQGPIPISSGSVPGLDKLHHAKHFHLGKNNLSGNIPPQLFSLEMALIHLLLRSSSAPTPTSFIPHSREPSSPEAERVLQFSRTRSFASPRQNLPDSSDHRSPTKHDNKSRIPRSNVLKSQHGTKIKESDQVIHTTKGKPSIRELFSVSGLDRQVLVEYDEDDGEEKKRGNRGVMVARYVVAVEESQMEVAGNQIRLMLITKP